MLLWATTALPISATHLRRAGTPASCRSSSCAGLLAPVHTASVSLRKKKPKSHAVWQLPPRTSREVRRPFRVGVTEKKNGDVEKKESLSLPLGVLAHTEGRERQHGPSSPSEGHCAGRMDYAIHRGKQVFPSS